MRHAAISLALLIAQCTATPVYALTADQLRNEALVNAAWGAVGYPATGRAICTQESSLRAHVVADKDKPWASYGLCGITIPAARMVIKRNPDIVPRNWTDKELAGALIYRPALNALFGALYFHWLRDVAGSWRDAVRAYNAGLHNRSAGKPYLRKIIRRVRE